MDRKVNYTLKSLKAIAQFVTNPLEALLELCADISDEIEVKKIMENVETIKFRQDYFERQYSSINQQISDIIVNLPNMVSSEVDNYLNQVYEFQEKNRLLIPSWAMPEGVMKDLDSRLFGVEPVKLNPKIVFYPEQIDILASKEGNPIVYPVKFQQLMLLLDKNMREESKILNSDMVSLSDSKSDLILTPSQYDDASIDNLVETNSPKKIHLNSPAKDPVINVAHIKEEIKDSGIISLKHSDVEVVDYSGIGTNFYAESVHELKNTKTEDGRQLVVPFFVNNIEAMLMQAEDNPDKELEDLSLWGMRFAMLYSNCGICYKGSGSSKFKVIHGCEDLVNIPKTFRKSCIISDYDKYIVDGVNVFELDFNSGIKYNEHLTFDEILSHEGWLALFQNNKDLLKKYASLAFKRLKKEHNHDTGMRFLSDTSPNKGELWSCCIYPRITSVSDPTWDIIYDVGLGRLDNYSGFIQVAHKSGKLKTHKKNDKINSFTLEERIGIGGFGEVWKASSDKFWVPVALKFFSHDFRKYLLNEYKILKTLHHENIVSLFYVEGNASDHYLVMESCDGNLREFMDNLSLDEKIDVIKQTAKGIAYAHSKNVVHGDLKPENILINDDLEVKICDFGLSVLRDDLNSSIKNSQVSSLSKKGFKGTLLYASPEQLEGKKPTEQSDIYSLSLVFFELLAGRRLGMREHPYDVLKKSGISNELVKIINDGLRYSPAERTKTVNEFLKQLADYNVSQSNTKSVVEVVPVREDKKRSEILLPNSNNLKLVDYSILHADTYAKGIHKIKNTKTEDGRPLEVPFFVNNIEARIKQAKQSPNTRLSEFKLWNAILDSNCAIIYKGNDTGLFKLVHNCPELTNIDKDLNKKYLLSKNYDNYIVDNITVFELDMNNPNTKYNTDLTLDNVLEHEGWQALFQKDIELLKKYAELTFKKIFQKNKKGMGFQINKIPEMGELRDMLLFNIYSFTATGSGAFYLYDSANFIKVVKPKKFIS